MAEKPIEDARSCSSEAANQKRSPRTGQAKQPIRSVRQGQAKRSSQSKALPRTVQSYGPITFVWQEARRKPRHTRRKHWLSQSEPSDGLSSDGHSSEKLLLSDGQNHIGQSDHLNGYFAVISRSHSSENLQDQMVIIVSANQIILTVIQPL